MEKDAANVTIDFFSASCTRDRFKNIEEKKITTYYLDIDIDKDGRGNLPGMLSNFFDNKIENLESFATYNTTPEFRDFSGTRWIRHGFLIKLSHLQKKKEKSLSSLTVNLELLDLTDRFKLNRDIEIKKDKFTLAAASKKDKILLLLFRYKEKDETYASVFNYDDFIVYSKNKTWNDKLFAGQQIIFPKSKALFTKGDKNIVLFAEKIIYDKKKNRLTGEEAKLFDRFGKKLGEGNKIFVSISDPQKFEIKK